ncbi:MAG TPA: fatty-acid oxidation protein subunit alpha [Cyanobacteria bacterium UBA11149]|nr:fatty-acid oxidation protein subunit alpha [Cyanobacteria bacterium UBA11367]HBE58839.1 fatty-acid oxidation protein subunit alpha [Cyanobacteria bacterium UBA11366]HBK63666.1 fatty-acid oxidation protein subunit alpha [Cyanobacteria bacterium UBA11166]HBR76441.1 fatty-acid oxidation protein subunit alpha [Cyanobacteria bacterium UBA11159]HBS68421.1 fatty-acid oxidation protein subunit alpha [Cyanobacteria bacterium UBA11153]HBW88522.1 fatty-acid oxidation protein subunit alpha [Cyanobacter
MAAKDLFHDAVQHGLEKDGWTIVANPLKFKFGKVRFEVDLAADRLIVAEREGKKIAVEVKSFLRASTITDFYAALGQFLSYRLGLRETHPDRVLYLAVPDDIYWGFFQLEFTQAAVEEYKLLIVVYNSENEEIVQWIK